MPSRRAPRLRTYRKRSGLYQREVSFLLGVAHRAKVSRYENGHRLPPLRTALAYATIFDAPLSALFPDFHKDCQAEIVERMRTLEGEFARMNVHGRSKRALRMERWLNERMAHIENQ